MRVRDLELRLAQLRGSGLGNAEVTFGAEPVDDLRVELRPRAGVRTPEVVVLELGRSVAADESPPGPGTFEMPNGGDTGHREQRRCPMPADPRPALTLSLEDVATIMSADDVWVADCVDPVRIVQGNDGEQDAYVSRVAFAALLDAADLALRLAEMAERRSPAGLLLGEFLTLHDAIEQAEREQAAARAAKGAR
jgi:hypothetical protein